MAHDNGPILLSCVTASTIRILVPLIISSEQMDEGLDVLESALLEVNEKKGVLATQPVESSA